MRKHIIWLLFLAGFTGCATRNTPAPIINATTAPTEEQAKPETAPTNSTSLGTLNDDTVQTEPVKPLPQPTTQAKPVAVLQPSSPTSNQWIIPTSGAVTHKFTPASKGIDYTGKIGQSINAINDGKVLYSGNGLKGYGNLIIIKHDALYLSAYAHNQANLVKVGDMVKRGQKIATMGTDNGKADLHLEIRQNGKPIDPLTLIK